MSDASYATAMIPRSRPVVALGLLAILAVACGSSPAPTASPSKPAASAAAFLPVQISTGFRVGDNRLVFTLADPASQRPIAAPDRPVTVGFHGPKGETIAPAPQTFIWAIQDQYGVYIGHASFPSAGAWTADFVAKAPGANEQTVTYSFDVLDRLDVISPGDAAPSVDTPTLTDVGGDLAKISTDAKPERRFYETSEADAIAAKKPFVLVFATPKFCTSSVCGPTLDKVKPIAAAHPEMTFINVEPYELTFTNGALQPKLDAQNQLVPAAATNAFKLSTEPFVFVVGSDGKVAASFELVFSPDEIEAAIREVETKA